MARIFRTHFILTTLPVLSLLAGCGEPGAPQPPSLNLPQVVRDLSATRTGSTVHLSWTTNNRTTDHAQVSGITRTHICRMEGNRGPCELVTDLPLKLGQRSQFDDALPTDKLQGRPQLLTYYVELINHARKSAGRSDPAYSATGQPVPEIVDLRVAALAQGVELHWDQIHWPESEGAQRLVRLVRIVEQPVSSPVSAAPVPSRKASLLSSSETPEALTQAFEVSATGNFEQQGAALDRTTRFGETYRYQAQAVETLTLENHSVSLVSQLSAPASVFTKDVFPPAVPQQLTAAADPASQAIDLSWSPDTEPDLAGYIVYRRDTGTSQPSSRVSGPALLAVPTFHDAEAKPGIRYAYSVTAVDLSGNESGHADEADETLFLRQ